MFERSPYGIKNRAIFLRAERVLYVEGQAARSGVITADQFFWRQIFSKFRPDLKISIQSRGSKSELLKIYEAVKESGDKNSIVAIDRDYDFLTGCKIRGKNIIYTRGYSWENDLLEKCLLEKVVVNILWSFGNLRNINLSIRKLITKRISDLEKLMRVDVYGYAIGRCVINRKKTGEFFNSRGRIDKNRVKIKVLELCRWRRGLGIKRDLPRVPRNWNVRSQGCGKLILRIVYLVFCGEARAIPRNFSWDEFMGAIAAAFSLSDVDEFSSSFRRYYSRQLARI